MQKPFICWRWYFVKNKFLQNSEKVLFPMWAILCCAFSDFHFIVVYLIIFFLLCYLLFVSFFSLFTLDWSIAQYETSISNDLRMFWFWTICNACHLNTVQSAPSRWSIHGMWQVCLKWTRKARFVIKLLFNKDSIFLFGFQCFCKNGSMIMQKMRQMNVCGGRIRIESGFRQANWFNGVGIIAAGTHDGNGVRVCVDVADGVVNAWHWLWYWCLGFPIDFVAIYIDTYLVSNCAKWCRWMPNGITIFYIRIWNVLARVYFVFFSLLFRCRRPFFLPLHST